jgi:RNA polymerase sigma-B factor
MRRRGHLSHETREAMIVAHLPLARRLARRYSHGAEPYDDLVQVASLGLVKAADRWDPERGVAFSAYAMPTILGELRRYFRDFTWDVRPPRGTQELSLAIGRAFEPLHGELGRPPTVAELAERLGRPAEEVVEAMQAGQVRALDSLDAAADAEESVGEQIGRDDDGYERVEARATLERLTSILDDHAREVMRMRYEEDLLQAEIATRLGVSQMSVSRVLRASLERLSAYCSGARVAALATADKPVA